MVTLVLKVALRLLLGREKIEGRTREKIEERTERTGKPHKTGCIIAPRVKRNSNYVILC